MKGTKFGPHRVLADEKGKTMGMIGVVKDEAHKRSIRP